MRLVYSVPALLALGLAAAGPAPAQESRLDVRYWPYREISFPISAERFTKDVQKPTKLRLYVNERGTWTPVVEKAPADLDVIDADTKRRGFRYLSPADGQYDFASQVEFAGGEQQPRTADLVAEYRVIFDTRPPLVRVAALGRTGIDWEVVDENLAANGIQLEGRWLGDAKYVPLTLRNFTPKPRDSFTWTGLRPGEVVEVRLVAKDKANQETVSRPIRLPGDADAAGLSTAAVGSGFGNPRDPDGGAAAGASAGQPRLEYSRTRELTISSKLQKVTRSGVSKAYLWVQALPSPNWVQAAEQLVNIQPNAADTISIPYSVKADGRYGFIVIPENGAGKKDPAPAPGDTPQYLIEVDTLRPMAEVKSAGLYGTGATGPRVEITWQASDLNLAPTPISLEYADSESAREWTPVTPEKLANTGRYVWEVNNPQLWQFYVRISAIDSAGNETRTVYPKKVLIDPDTPKATIEKIVGNTKTPQSREADHSGVERTSNPSAPPAPLPASVSPTPTPVVVPIQIPAPLTPSTPVKLPPAGAPIGPDLPNLPTDPPKPPPAS